MATKTKSKTAAPKFVPTVALVSPDAKTSEIFTALKAAAATAPVRVARKIEAVARDTAPALIDGEREIAPNVYARIEGRELVLTIPLEDALAANPPVDGHAVVATAGSRFGALPIGHKGLRLNLYLAMGSAKKAPK